MQDLSSTRKILPCSQSNRGYIPSKKVKGGIAEYESTLERDLYLLLEHDPSIKQYQHQPMKLEYKDEKGHKKHYTPDVLVITGNEDHYLLEIKPRAVAVEGYQTFLRRWMIAEQEALRRGWTFGIVTEEGIRTPRLRNIWFCWGSSRLRNVNDEIAFLCRLVENSSGDMSYIDSCRKLGETFSIGTDHASSIVAYCVYNGLVRVNEFCDGPLKSSTLLLPIDKNEDKFPPVMECLEILTPRDLDDRNHAEAEKVKEDKETREQNIDVRIVNDDDAERRSAVIREWEQTPSKLRTSGWKEDFAEKHGVSLRTIRRWLKHLREDPERGLLSRYGNYGRRRTLNERILSLMEEYRVSFLAQDFGSVKDTYGEFEDACKAEELSPPSYSTFWRFIKTCTSFEEEVLAKMGSNAHRRMFLPSMDTYQTALHPYQVIQIDNTPLDVFAVHGETGEVLKTPHLISAIDVFTRVVTGYYLTIGHPSRLSVLSALKMTIKSKSQETALFQTEHIWPLSGLPVLVLVDNGMDYRADDVKRFCMKYQIILEFAPLRKPEYKAYIENWFSLLENGLKGENVPGYRSSIPERRERPEYNPEKSAVLSLADIEEWIVSWIVDKYHLKNQHNDNRPSPYIRYREAMRGEGTIPLPAPVQLPKTDLMRLEFEALLHDSRQLTRNGIARSYINYNSDEIQSLLKAIGPKNVETIVDPRNIRNIHIVNPETNEIIRVPATGPWLNDLNQYFGSSPVPDSVWRTLLKSIRSKNSKGNPRETIRKGAKKRRTLIKDAMTRADVNSKKGKKKLIEDEFIRECSKKAVNNEDVSVEDGCDEDEWWNIKDEEKKREEYHRRFKSYPVFKVDIDGE